MGGRQGRENVEKGTVNCLNRVLKSTADEVAKKSLNLQTVCNGGRIYTLALVSFNGQGLPHGRQPSYF